MLLLHLLLVVAIQGKMMVDYSKGMRHTPYHIYHIKVYKYDFLWKSTNLAVIQVSSSGFDPLDSADYKLSSHLLRKYPDPQAFHVLPTRHPKLFVDVSVRVVLYHIFEMNERAQSLTTNCEVITQWDDAFLMWDPREYGNITSTSLPWSSIWTPDIVLINAAGNGDEGMEKEH